MSCPCDRTGCECVNLCRCCPFICHRCPHCLELRRQLGGYCRPCGGYLPSYVCSVSSVWRQTGFYPNLDFIRIHKNRPRHRAPVERANVERSDPGAYQSTITLSRRSDPGAYQSTLTASRRSDPEAYSSTTTTSQSDPEASPSPSRESSPFDESLQFQMDDIDFSTEVSPSTSPGAKSGDFHGSSHFSTNKSTSGTPLDLRGQPSNIGRYCPQSSDAAGMKLTESNKSKMSIWTPLQKLDTTALKLRETQTEMPIANEDVARCSNHNPGTSTSDIKESRVIRESALRTVADLNRSELIEKETTQSVSHAVSPSEDEYASDSLPSNLNFDDSPPSTFVVSRRSPTHKFSSSAPAIYHLPERTRELKSSEEKTSIAHSASETSSASNLSNIEILPPPDSRQRDKLRISSESSSVETRPENMPNGARCNTFHDRTFMPSNSVSSSQLNNTAIQTEPTQPGTSQMLSTLNSLKLSSPKVSKSVRQRSSSKSDSPIVNISEQTDSSEDSSTNNSPKKN